MTFFDLCGHKSGKDRIPCVLRGCREDAVIDLVFVHPVELFDTGLYGFPLVIAEVVDQQHKQGLPFLEHWKDLVFE